MEVSGGGHHSAAPNSRGTLTAPERTPGAVDVFRQRERSEWLESRLIALPSRFNVRWVADEDELEPDQPREPSRARGCDGRD